MRRFNDQQVDTWVGRVLRAGTVLSCSIASLGIVLYLFRNSSADPAYGVFPPGGIKFQSFSAMFLSAIHGDAIAIIEIGILFLIATPVARVAFLVGAFALERDRLYVAVSVLVLAILLYSIFFIM